MLLKYQGHLQINFFIHQRKKKLWQSPSKIIDEHPKAEAKRRPILATTYSATREEAWRRGLALAHMRLEWELWITAPNPIQEIDRNVAPSKLIFTKLELGGDHEDAKTGLTYIVMSTTRSIISFNILLTLKIRIRGLKLTCSKTKEFLPFQMWQQKKAILSIKFLWSSFPKEFVIHQFFYSFQKRYIIIIDSSKRKWRSKPYQCSKFTFSKAMWSSFSLFIT